MKGLHELQQTKIWSGDFGAEYTSRNLRKPEEVDQLYEDLYGISRSTMNREFLEGLDRSSSILEIGANIGNQLLLLKAMGFVNLFALELQEYPIRISEARRLGVHYIQGSAFALPFSDASFDMVFTSGVLIHIDPEYIAAVIDEIYRCSREYIWGCEYYNEDIAEINYRGHAQLLWKGDYAGLYLQRFKDLASVNKKIYPYRDNPAQCDQMFLLKKQTVDLQVPSCP